MTLETSHEVLGVTEYEAEPPDRKLAFREFTVEFAFAHENLLLHSSASTCWWMRPFDREIMYITAWLRGPNI